MRGPGDIEGTMQSGIAFDLKIANLATDQQIVQLARDRAEAVLKDDPSLSKPVHSILLATLQENFEKAIDLSRIS